MGKDNETKKIKLSDLIDIESIQRIQDSYSKMTGIAAVTIDMDGKCVTRISNCARVCEKYIRSSEQGLVMCGKCGMYAAKIAVENPARKAYTCHAGIVEFAFPIMLENEMVGCFMGGQVRMAEPDKKNVEEMAERFNVSPVELYDAMMELPVMTQAQIEKAASFLQDIAIVISEMIAGNYLAQKANDDIERAANLKSDFLANMSHEIRTPMNAVIGMAEVALRENLTDSAREYITQIKNSGTVLLGVINDILDFSKIESGKMDMVPVSYETMSIINDINNVLLSQLKDKDVELVIEVEPGIPHYVYGDNVRIKQVLLNLASNAVKFTNEGQVKISLSCQNGEDNNTWLTYTVEDTGIGIRREELDKIFGSFQQADSKRNRNVEGTGLGLAISKRLVEMMDGKIEVKSNYGKGSVFSFTIKQKVVDETPGVIIKDKEDIKAYGFFASRYAARQFERDGRRLNMNFKLCNDRSEINNIECDNSSFLFIDYSRLDGGIKQFIEEHPLLTVVLLTEFGEIVNENLNNVITMPKPLYVYNEALVFNREEIGKIGDSMEQSVYDFTAPEARILIVDDNAINLTVAEGLLNPIGMQIDTALSGEEAIARIKKNNGYDIVFMDHMMPVMDGIEATRHIREELPEFNDTIIIALTANSVSGTKNIFTEAGMNDYVAKPIEVRDIIFKIKKYLPKNKIKKGMPILNNVEQKSEDALVVGDLDTASALKLLGGETLFFKVLKDYYGVIELKAEKIRRYEQTEDWPAYTIEVHALKSASRQIGANKLADLAYEMEKAGNAKNGALIHSNTETLLSMYMAYKPVLAPFCEEKEETADKPPVDNAELAGMLDELQEAFDNLDMDLMEEIYGRMDSYSYDEEGQELIRRLKDAVEYLDMDAGEEIIGLFRNRL